MACIEPADSWATPTRAGCATSWPQSDSQCGPGQASSLHGYGTSRPGSYRRQGRHQQQVRLWRFATRNRASLTSSTRTLLTSNAFPVARLLNQLHAVTVTGCPGCLERPSAAGGLRFTRTQIARPRDDLLAGVAALAESSRPLWPRRRASAEGIFSLVQCIEPGRRRPRNSSQSANRSAHSDLSSASPAESVIA